MHAYKEIAALAIKNWYLWNEEDEVATKKAREIAQIINNQEIESGIPNAEELAERFQNENLKDLIYGISALTSIKAGIRSLADTLNISEIQSMSDSELDENLLSENEAFETLIFNGSQSILSDPVKMIEKLEQMGLQKKIEGLSSEEIKRFFIQIAIVDALEAIHDKWVSDNEKKFFAEKRKNKQYMHVNFEAIGWKDVDLDKIFLTPIMAVGGIEENLKDLKAEYEHRQVEIYKGWINAGVRDMAREYEPLKSQPKIIEALDEQGILDHMRELIEVKAGIDIKKENPRFLSEEAKMKKTIGHLEKSQKELEKALECEPDEIVEEQIGMIKMQVECVKRKIEKAFKEKSHDLSLLKKVLENATIEDGGKTLKTSKNITQEELNAVLKFYKNLETINFNGKIIDLHPQSQIIGEGNIDNVIEGNTSKEPKQQLVNPNLGKGER